MSDLVERLRGGIWETVQEADDLMHEAATEIERLRVERDELLKPINQDEGYEALKAECARLTRERDEARRRFTELRAECIKIDWRNEFRIRKLLETDAYPVERLRAALESISELPTTDPLLVATNIAREALK